MTNKIFSRYKELVLHCSVAILVGIVSGIFMGILGRLLYAANAFRAQHIEFILPFLPIAGLFIVYAYQKYGYENAKGLSIVFKTGLGERDDMPKALVPLMAFATLVSNFFGASIGRESAAVQIGSAISYSIAKKIKFIPDKSMFIVIGIAAGFAGLFRTPLGATIFALEVLITGIVMYEALLPTLLAAFTAYYVSGLFGLSRLSFYIKPTYIFNLDMATALKIILLGIIFGLVGTLFTKSITFLKKFLDDYFPDPRKKIFFVGIFLAILLYVFHYGRYSAAGDGLLNAVYNGGVVYNYDWIIKLFLTALSVSIGFQGGEVVPLFAIGSTLGFVIAPLFGLPPDFVAALGLIAVFGSATGTVFSPVILATEIFKSEYGIYFIIISCVAYSFHSYQTIYHAQERYVFFPSKLTSKKIIKTDKNLEKDKKE